jgi:hypothetical protein
MELTMVWTEVTRRQYWRDGLRDASNLTDAEQALSNPSCPPRVGSAVPAPPVCGRWLRPSSISPRPDASGVSCPTRRQKRHMRRFKSARHAQQFLSTHRLIHNHFQLRRHRLSAIEYRTARARLQFLARCGRCSPRGLFLTGLEDAQRQLGDPTSS